MEGLRDRLRRLHGPVDRHRRRGRRRAAPCCAGCGCRGRSSCSPSWSSSAWSSRSTSPARSCRSARRGCGSRRPSRTRRRPRSQYAAPVPRSVPPIDPLLIAGGAACMLLVDIIAGTLRRVPLAGLPLLTIYSIPVSLLGGGVSWIIFTLTTVGFLLMLYLQESRQIARWGRPLGNDGVGPERVRRQQRRPAVLGGRDRRRRDGAGDRRPALHPDLRHRAVRQRLRPGRRRQDQDREPDGRPQARPPAGQRRAGHHDPDRRPQPGLPAHLGAQPLLRQRVEPRRPPGAGRPARDRRAAAHHRAVEHRADQGVRLPRRHQRQLRLHLAAHPVPDLGDRRARRLALRQLDDGRDVLRRGPARRRA